MLFRVVWGSAGSSLDHYGSHGGMIVAVGVTSRLLRRISVMLVADPRMLVDLLASFGFGLLYCPLLRL